MAANTTPQADSTPTPVQAPAGGNSGGILAILLALGLATVGGVGGGILLHSTLDLFPVISSKAVIDARGVISEELKPVVHASKMLADYKNIPLALGLMGASVASAIGLAIGLSQSGKSRGPAAGLVIGLLLGFPLTAGGAAAAIQVREAIKGWNTLDATGQPDLVKTQLATMARQLPTWVATAVALGLTGGIVGRSSSRGKSVFGAALAGVLVAEVLFPTISGLLFALDDATGLVPGGIGNRILWVALNAAWIGLFVGRTGGTSSSPSGV